MKAHIISIFISASLMANEIAKPEKITASEIIIQAHIALGDLLHAQTTIRTDNDLENFKTKSSEILLKMKELSAKIPEAAEPTDFERREAIGIAMKYRYELYPPSQDGDPYLNKVPEKYHGDLRNMAADKPPEIANLWHYITEVTKPIEEDGFLIPIGTEKIDPSISIVVSLGRKEERPKISVDPATRKLSFVEGPQYIEINVVTPEGDSTLVLYSQMFPIPNGFDTTNFKVSDAVKIEPEARILTITIPEVEHTYKLPAKRPQD